MDGKSRCAWRGLSTSEDGRATELVVGEMLWQHAGAAGAMIDYVCCIYAKSSIYLESCIEPFLVAKREPLKNSRQLLYGFFFWGGVIQSQFRKEGLIAKGQVESFRREGFRSSREGKEGAFLISQPKRLPNQECKASLLEKPSFTLGSTRSIELRSMISDHGE